MLVAVLRRQLGVGKIKIGDQVLLLAGHGTLILSVQQVVNITALVAFTGIALAIVCMYKYTCTIGTMTWGERKKWKRGSGLKNAAPLQKMVLIDKKHGHDIA